jgi:hypothetical protein
MEQYICVEGNDWNDSWTWTISKNSATMGALTDPSNLVVYQMHQCLESDGSGTHAECVSATIGQERFRVTTKWLRSSKSNVGLMKHRIPARHVCEVVSSKHKLSLLAQKRHFDQPFMFIILQSEENIQYIAHKAFFLTSHLT